MHERIVRHRVEQNGFTIIELLVVLTLLVVVAGVLVPLLSPTVGAKNQSVEEVVTLTTLQRIRDVILGTNGAPGYLQDLGILPDELTDLLQFDEDEFLPEAPELQQYDPITRRGWRGPYLVAESAADLRDGWGNPLVLVVSDMDPPARLVSAGPDGNVMTDADNLEVVLE